MFSYVRYDADLPTRHSSRFGVINPTVRRQVRKLDAVDHLPLMGDLGRHVAHHVGIDRHFDGFLA